ncbi:DUF4998 domain-containing protein [Niabella drilacis]|uniref:DUF4998 domain-containing protein n=1 Tax=Niabella drilacis (strain DSM 25811 / CCM 8410 / CCUG 62505 / LMG 26954 / E90) TaxID=1285928 RepID=A0A1G6YMK5_NIADE|nr:DUF4998 domain-containing protein [Niabella drilacis]SDD90897.1 protein of unknown function [Niabella drilacis]
MFKLKYFHFLLLLSLFLVVACEKMDDTYRHFVVPDGLTYVGKADPVFLNPGRKRIKLSWLRGTDQKTTMARIYWNSKTDSVDVPVTKGNPKDTVSVIIGNLEEGSYVFQIYTFDNNHNSSIRVDALGASYGSLYEGSLVNRIITGIKKGGDTAIVTMLSVDTTAMVTRFRYSDQSGAIVDTLVDSETLTVRLPNMNKDTLFDYITLYKPISTCLDTFYSPLRNYPAR